MLAITTVAALMLLPGFASQDEAGTPAAGADYIAAREAEEQRRREEDERFAAARLRQQAAREANQNEAPAETEPADDAPDTPATAGEGEPPAQVDGSVDQLSEGAGGAAGLSGEEGPRPAADEIRFQKQLNPTGESTPKDPK